MADGFLNFKMFWAAETKIPFVYCFGSKCCSSWSFSSAKRRLGTRKKQSKLYSGTYLRSVLIPNWPPFCRVELDYKPGYKKYFHELQTKDRFKLFL